MNNAKPALRRLAEPLDHRLPEAAASLTVFIQLSPEHPPVAHHLREKLDLTRARRDALASLVDPLNRQHAMGGRAEHDEVRTGRHTSARRRRVAHLAHVNMRVDGAQTRVSLQELSGEAEVVVLRVEVATAPRHLAPVQIEHRLPVDHDRFASPKSVTVSQYPAPPIRFQDQLGSRIVPLGDCRTHEHNRKLR